MTDASMSSIALFCGLCRSKYTEILQYIPSRTIDTICGANFASLKSLPTLTHEEQEILLKKDINTLNKADILHIYTLALSVYYNVDYGSMKSSGTFMETYACEAMMVKYKNYQLAQLECKNADIFAMLVTEVHRHDLAYEWKSMPRVREIFNAWIMQMFSGTLSRAELEGTISLCVAKFTTQVFPAIFGVTLMARQSCFYESFLDELNIRLGDHCGLELACEAGQYSLRSKIFGIADFVCPATKTAWPSDEPPFVIPFRLGLKSFKFKRNAVHEPGNCVYFVGKDDYDGKIKIGKTNNLAKRLSALNTGSSSRLVVYKQVMRDDMSELERSLHKMMIQKNIKGEWFSATLEEIDDICNNLATMKV